MARLPEAPPQSGLPELEQMGELVLEFSGALATITLNRPAHMNTINKPLAFALMTAMTRLEHTEGVRCLLLQGSGEMFCAGGDLATFSACGDQAGSYVKEVVTYLHEAISVIHRIPIPVVASVQGAAAGAGLGLACACDIVLAADDARFVMAYTQTGVTPDGSSTWFLPRIVGLRRALQLTLLNQRLNAEEAREWGLVTSVYPAAELAAQARLTAMKLASGPTLALAEAKRLLRASLDTPLESQMLDEGQQVSSIMGTADAQEGMRAFLEKRTPHYTGRSE